MLPNNGDILSELFCRKQLEALNHIKSVFEHYPTHAHAGMHTPHTLTERERERERGGENSLKARRIAITKATEVLGGKCFKGRPVCKDFSSCIWGTLVSVPEARLKRM